MKDGPVTKEALLKELGALRRELEELKAGKSGRNDAQGCAPDPLDILQSVLDNSLSAIHIKDTEGRFLMVNRWFEKNSRFTREKLVGLTPYDLYPKDIVDALLQADRRVIKTRKPFEVEEEVPLEDGVHTFISAKYPILDSNGKVRAVCGISTDITERKTTEEALRRSEASLKNAQRLARFGNWEWNVLKDEIYRSDEIYRILGIKKNKLAPTFEAILNVIHPADREAVRKAVDTAMRGGEPFNIDYRIERPDGSVRLVHSEAETVFDEAGNPVILIGTAQDITELRENERKYLDQLRFLQTLIDTIPSPIFYKDAAGRYLGCNTAFEKFIGKSKKKIEGKTVYGIAPRELADKYRKMDLALFREGGSQRYEAKVRYTDGSLRDIIFSKAVFRDSRGETAGLVGVMLDVTDLRRAAAEKEKAEARLRKLKKTNGANHQAGALKELAAVLGDLSRGNGKTGEEDLRAGLRKAKALVKKLAASGNEKRG